MRSILELRRRRQILAATGAGAVGLGAWVGLGRQRDTSLEDVRRRGELRVGYAVEPPYAFVRPDGRPGGESPEVAAEVADRLGLRRAWVVTEFERLLPGLEAERFDVIAAGMFITPERAARVRFMQPELRVRPGWLAAAGHALALGPYEQARPSPRLRVAVLDGSIEHSRFTARHGPGHLVVVPDANTGRLAVSTGAAEALALSLPTVLAMARSSQGQLVALAAGDEATDLVAMAVRLPAIALAEAIDAVLSTYLGSERHLAMLGELGLGANDLPPGGRDAGRRQ